MTRIESLHKKLENLETKRSIILQRILKLQKEMQSICTHSRVEKSGGGRWSEWPDYGSYPYHLRCLECGFGVSSNEREGNKGQLYDYMNKNIISDKS